MARRTLVALLIGALIGTMLCAGAFLIATLLDGSGIGEAFGYSLIVAILGAFLGGIVGLIVGLGNLRMFGGALAGLLVALAIVGFYVLGFGGEEEYSRFLSESRVIIAGLTSPLILTGMFTAFLSRRRER
jgi:hypothetical protein